MDITSSKAPVGMKGAAPGKKLQATDLRELMGDRAVQQFIGTTYRIFQNQDFGFYHYDINQQNKP